MADSIVSDRIKIILPPPQLPPASSAGTRPEGSASLPRESKEEMHFGFWKNGSVKKIGDQLVELQGQIMEMVGGITKKVSGNLQLEEVTVGLAISIDGDIGIVSAGAEASIELAFKVH
jgi:hypothetical protein